MSPYRLREYIGDFNANTALVKASNMRTDKITLLFRKHGKIEIYLK